MIRLLVLLGVLLAAAVVVIGVSALVAAARRRAPLPAPGVDRELPPVVAGWVRWERFYLDLAESARRSGDTTSAENHTTTAGTYRALIDQEHPR